MTWLTHSRLRLTNATVRADCKYSSCWTRKGIQQTIRLRSLLGRGKRYRDDKREDRRLRRAHRLLRQANSAVHTAGHYKMDSLRDDYLCTHIYNPFLLLYHHLIIAVNLIPVSQICLFLKNCESEIFLVENQ